MFVTLTSDTYNVSFMIITNEPKIRFTVFLIPSLAQKLKAMPRKKRNTFVNEKLMGALEREELFSALEDLKHTKTSYESGPEFIEKIRKEWTI